MAAWESWAAPMKFLGDLFIRALKLIIIPLVVASLVTGVRSIGDTAQLGRVGLRTMIYFMVTTLMAVVTGLIAVNLIRPGVGLNMSYDAAETPPIKPLLEVFRDIIPPNALAAFAANDMLPSIAVAMLLGAGLLSIGAKGDPLAALHLLRPPRRARLRASGGPRSARSAVRRGRACPGRSAGPRCSP